MLRVPRSNYYRWKTPKVDRPKSKRPAPPRALSEEDTEEVIGILHEDRFADKPPAAVYASLLDEGVYLCSIRTMYRKLHELDEVKERRNIKKHRKYKKPELLATAPNQLWSWDITKLKGPVKWTYFYLYVILDVYSRYVVGWMVAPRETAKRAKELIDETCFRERITSDQLIIHSDRGSPMTSKTVALFLADLGVIKSLSRPRVSNDNPYSESHFKTLKDRPQFPERFSSIDEARAICNELFSWYNDEHYHSGIALMTPYVVHHGLADEYNKKRQIVLSDAYAVHPERFVRGEPKTLVLPEGVWINKPMISTMQGTT